MPTQTFSVIVRGHLTPEVINAVHEVAPDAMLSIDRDELGGLVEFDREIEGDAIKTVLVALGTIEGIDGVRVAQSEPKNANPS